MFFLEPNIKLFQEIPRLSPTDFQKNPKFWFKLGQTEGIPPTCTQPTLPEAVKGKELQRTTRGLIPLGTCITGFSSSGETITSII